MNARKEKKRIIREHRIRINLYLDQVMVYPKNNFILPRLRAIRDIEDAQRERRQIETIYKTKEVLYNEMAEAINNKADKSQIRIIEKKLKMNGLPTIPEEDILMENEDIDKLLSLNDKIKKLVTKRDEGLDINPVNRKMYEVAEQIMENEF